jgi:hypothetical protein
MLYIKKDLKTVTMSPFGLRHTMSTFGLRHTMSTFGLRPNRFLQSPIINVWVHNQKNRLRFATAGLLQSPVCGP